MKHKIRLGPIAVFLTVIAAVVATLAMLTFATSRADAALAERFARVTSIRYGLEIDGSQFMKAADAALKGYAAQFPEGSGETENGWKYTVEKDGYELSIELEKQDGHSGYEVKKWKIMKLWAGDDPFEDLWLG